jgi:proteasome lid subunit RPN8/RPN11
MFDAVRDMRGLGLEILAIYHSHPTSAPVPSKTDLERVTYPDVVSLIISLQSGPPETRGWWLTVHDYREAAWELCD